MQRRKYLTTISTIGVVGIAGCSSDNPASVSVYVENSAGEGIPNATVLFQYDEGVFSEPETKVEGSTDKSGIFEAEVEENEYTIVIIHNEYGELEKEITIESSEKQVPFLFRKGSSAFEITGHHVENRPIKAGDSVSIDMNIKNTTRRGLTKTVQLEVLNDIKAEKEVTLEGDSKTTTSLNFQTEGLETGEYTYSLLLDRGEYEGKINVEDEIEFAEKTLFEKVDQTTGVNEVRGIEVSGSSESGLEIEVDYQWVPCFSCDTPEEYESEFNDIAVNVLESVFTTDLNIEYALINGFVETVNEYGEEDEARAHTVGLNKELAGQINWDGYNSEYLPDHADEYYFGFNLFLDS